jgi:hypothetical protein
MVRASPVYMKHQGKTNQPKRHSTTSVLPHNAFLARRHATLHTHIENSTDGVLRLRPLPGHAAACCTRLEHVLCRQHRPHTAPSQTKAQCLRRFRSIRTYHQEGIPAKEGTGRRRQTHIVHRTYHSTTHFTCRKPPCALTYHDVVIPVCMHVCSAM